MKKAIRGTSKARCNKPRPEGKDRTKGARTRLRTKNKDTSVESGNE